MKEITSEARKKFVDAFGREIDKKRSVVGIDAQTSWECPIDPYVLTLCLPNGKELSNLIGYYNFYKNERNAFQKLFGLGCVGSAGINSNGTLCIISNDSDFNGLAKEVGKAYETQTGRNARIFSN